MVQSSPDLQWGVMLTAETSGIRIDNHGNHELTCLQSSSIILVQAYHASLAQTLCTAAAACHSMTYSCTCEHGYLPASGASSLTRYKDWNLCSSVDSRCNMQSTAL